MVRIVAVKKQGGASPVIAAMPLTGQERKLIELLRKLDYGEVRIVVKESVIVQIEEKNQSNCK